MMAPAAVLPAVTLVIRLGRWTSTQWQRHWIDVRRPGFSASASQGPAGGHVVAY